MNNGRYSKHSTAGKKKLSKQFVLLLSVVLVLSAVVGGSVAYLTASSDQVVNNFKAGSVDCEVQTDGTVKNVGNITADIRAYVVVNWAEKENPDNIYWKAPNATISVGTGWTLGNDGYYYYNDVAAGGVTTALSATTNDANPDATKYSLQVTIVAEAIQAEGRGNNAWGEAPAN